MTIEDQIKDENYNMTLIERLRTMYNLIEYSDNYEKTSGSLWQYFRDEPDDNNIEDCKI